MIEGKSIAKENVSEFKDMGNGVIAHKRDLPIQKRCFYRIYEQTRDILAYYAWTHDDNYGWLGELARKALPPSIDDLPFGIKRSLAVKHYRESVEMLERAYLIAAFPEDFET